ncbi:MAG: hypothetical protein ACRCY3_13725 [Sphingorhabdus sp.]
MSNAPPLREGYQQITDNWGLTLPYPMASRIDEGALVFWHSPRRFTAWINSWSPEDTTDAKSCLSSLKQDFSPDSFDIIEEEEGNILRYAYRLAEDADDKRLASFSGFVISPDGEYIQLGIYFDDPASIDDALYLWRSFLWCGG